MHRYNLLISITAVVVSILPRAADAAAVRAYVANILSHDVTIIDVSSLTAVATVPVGQAPAGIAISPDGTTVYVANAGSNDVSIIDTASDSVVGTVPVGLNPIGVAFTPDGLRAYVANFANPGSLSVIDTGTRSVIATVPVAAGPHGVAITPNGAFAYVTQEVFNPGFVSVISTADNTVAPTVTVGANPRGLRVTPDGTRVYVADGDSDTVSVIDTATNSVIATIPMGPKPVDLGISPDGAFVYVANTDFNSVGGGNVSVVDTATNTVATVIVTGGHPVGGTVTPDGTLAFIGTTGCCGGPNTVSVIDTATNSIVATIPVGTVVSGIAIGTVSVGCTPAPRTCRAAGTSTLQIKNSGDERDRLVWKWGRGEATSQNEFGDPTDDTDYSLCLYAGSSSALIGRAQIASDAIKWSTLGTRGYRYRDASADESGITKVLLKGSAADRSRALVKGKGADLPDLPLPLAAPVTAQFVNGDSALCWGAEYGDSALRQNDANRLRAKVP